ncbi:hypothetical protein CAPTEDRAFT_175505 [Capitella teleta]|uniref:Protein kinase domain-containing protein n=1 Tax=Capitella teleta TaxID=283909 RepID=R7T4K4_CAPTE|nr:hypothetical protein CAPTEDRAFT_175505 [Capitella teleta]|eukprot:ELT87972.1 hypothetical protein CAPTEDRAFT_175505 [Capitella teleta]
MITVDEWKRNSAEDSPFKIPQLASLLSSKLTVQSSTPATSLPNKPSQQFSPHLSAIPKMPSLADENLGIREGNFSGCCKHRDGIELGIDYQIKRVPLEDGGVLFCLWVSLDANDPLTQPPQNDITLASSLNSSRGASSITQESCKEVEATKDYESKYETLESIGKGAFGFVKLARQKQTGDHVVVKFIRRSKVLKDCWAEDATLGLVPLEVSLLAKLKHPNIVTMIDYFKGGSEDELDQLVMEKHGSGMDLFEFIDRSPNLDEALASYIFRQVVSAVSYLHSLDILHRDIKDENIIMNEQFQVKLIDFGSAAFMKPGKFSEYALISIHRYSGPELEMWSLGVTLYTLVFGENPFYDIEETINCVMSLPFDVSQDLTEVLEWLLCPLPEHRATIGDMEGDPWVQQPFNLNDYTWKDVLPNFEFHGNTAADNREDTPDVKKRLCSSSSSFGGHDDGCRDDNSNERNIKIPSMSKDSVYFRPACASF